MTLRALCRFFIGAAVVAQSTGCRDRTRPTAATVRDSAGVTIVESSSATLDALPSWTVGPPSRTIGRSPDDPAHQLSDVVAAARLSDGRLLIADAESRELRVYDAEGRGILTFGGRGEGPGELPWLREVNVQAGDTVTVSAWPFGLLSRFGPNGEYLDSRRIGPFWSGTMNRILEDGSLLLYHADGGLGNNVELWLATGDEPTFVPTPALVRAFEDGRLDTLRMVRGDEWFKLGKLRLDLWAGPIPFRTGTLTAVAEPTIFLGEPDHAEIEVRSLDGTLERRIRWTGRQVHVSARDREIFAQRQREGLRQPARATHLERWLGAVPFPETKGAFLDLTTDRGGRLWVRLPAPAGSDDPWLVLDRDGVAVARVTVPAGARLLDIGDDWMLLTLLDELDVPRVEERPLSKP